MGRRLDTLPGSSSSFANSGTARMASEGDLYCRIKGQDLDLMLMTCLQQVHRRGCVDAR